MAFSDIDNERLAQLLNTKRGQEAYAKADVSYALNIAKSSEPEERATEIAESTETVTKCNLILKGLKERKKKGLPLKQKPKGPSHLSDQGKALYNADKTMLDNLFKAINRGEKIPSDAGMVGKVVGAIAAYNADLNRRNAKEVLKSKPLSDQNVDNVLGNVFKGNENAPSTPELDMKGNPIPTMPTSTGKNNGVYGNQNVREAAKKHAQRQQDENYSYTANTISMGGVNTKINREVSDFGLDTLKEERTPMENTEALIQKVTKAIETRVGDWSRVKSFAIVSGQLLIDGVIHAPKLGKKLDRTKYISGTVEYLEAGCLASLFDWSKLYHATNIRYMWFDTDYSVELGVFLNDGVSFSVPYYFEYFDKLQHLTICDHSITREELEAEKQAPVQQQKQNRDWVDADWEEATPRQRSNKSLYQSVRQNRRNFDITSTNLYNNVLSGYNLSPKKGTQALQNFAIGGLHNYVRNKGNKNLISFGFGTVGMSALALSSVGLNFATHITTGLVKTGVNGLGSFFARGDSNGFAENGTTEDITE